MKPVLISILLFLLIGCSETDEENPPPGKRVNLNIKYMKPELKNLRVTVLFKDEVISTGKWGDKYLSYVVTAPTQEDVNSCIVQFADTQGNVVYEGPAMAHRRLLLPHEKRQEILFQSMESAGN